MPAFDSEPWSSADAPHELAAYFAFNLVLTVIWAATRAGCFRAIWPLLGCEVGLASSGPSFCAHGRRRSGGGTARV